MRPMNIVPCRVGQRPNPWFARRETSSAILLARAPVAALHLRRGEADGRTGGKGSGLGCVRSNQAVAHTDSTDVRPANRTQHAPSCAYSRVLAEVRGSSSCPGGVSINPPPTNRSRSSKSLICRGAASTSRAMHITMKHGAPFRICSTCRTRSCAPTLFGSRSEFVDKTRNMAPCASKVLRSCQTRRKTAPSLFRRAPHDHRTLASGAPTASNSLEMLMLAQILPEAETARSGVTD